MDLLSIILSFEIALSKSLLLLVKLLSLSSSRIAPISSSITLYLEEMDLEWVVDGE